MRPLYFILRLTLPISLNIFFRRTKTLNAQKTFKAQTIFIINHPSAFIDPLVAANFQWPIVFFMTRSDVFKAWLRPVTWACHMVPIYRTAEDGSDSAKKNVNVFRGIRGVLKRKKSLIVFGEGYTDNVFIRSLKPIKKGAARMGFQTMEAFDWEEDIKIQPIGINYSHPKYFRSDMLMACGKVFHLKDYKEDYEENPNKTLTQLTRELDAEMRRVITCVENKELAEHVEQVMKITRKGMNHECYDSNYSLEERYNYSRNLADRFNNEFDEQDPYWQKLHHELSSYFGLLEKEKIHENWVHRVKMKGSKSLFPKFLYLTLMFPLFLLSIVHVFIPHLLVSQLVEKIFKRDVFWSGVKMLLGSVVIGLYNIPIFFLFPVYIYESYWLATAYYLIVPPVSIIIYRTYFYKLKDFIKLSRTPLSKLQHLVKKRDKVQEFINERGL